MSISDLLRWIVAAGAVGGIVNAILADNTFGVPKKIPPPAAGGGAAVRAGDFYRPSWPGWILAVAVNIILGAVASSLSWMMYGPLSGCPIFGQPATPTAICRHPEFTMSLSVLGTAIVIGIAGPRWITNEVDKKLLKDAAAEAMGKAGNNDVARKITMAGPAETLSLVRNA